MDVTLKLLNKENEAINELNLSNPSPNDVPDLGRESVHSILFVSHQDNSSTTLWDCQGSDLLNLVKCEEKLDKNILIKSVVILTAFYSNWLLVHVPGNVVIGFKKLVRAGFVTEVEKENVFLVPNDEYDLACLDAAGRWNEDFADDYKKVLTKHRILKQRFGSLLPNLITNIKIFAEWINQRIYLALLNVYADVVDYKLTCARYTDQEVQLFYRNRDGLRKGADYIKIISRLQQLKEHVNIYINAQPFATVPQIYKAFYAETCRELSWFYANHHHYAKAISEADDGIMKGAQSEDRNLSKLANYLSDKLVPCPRIEIEEQEYSIPASMKNSKEILTCTLPSLEMFYKHCVEGGQPMVIKGLVQNFPIFEFFDFDYLNKKHGYRRVPVEFGSSYMSEDFSQQILTIHEYFRDFVAKADAPKGYLAQHALLDQLDLTNFVIVPDYHVMLQAGKEEVDVKDDKPSQENDPTFNVFIGPAGTISPLHFDPRPNFFCQIRGSKFVRLVNPKFIPKLYMGTGMNAHVTTADLESPDFEQYPLLKEVETEDVVVEPGDCLFMPAGYLHLMRSLTPSISLSIWT